MIEEQLLLISIEGNKKKSDRKKANFRSAAL